MSFNLTYGLLFEVTFYHNYFLNDGINTFESMSDDDKEQMIQKYNADAFVTITPTLETNTVLKNYKMLFKKTKMGFRIYIKVKEADEFDPFITIPVDLSLNFLITINDYQFENYTNLDFAPHQVFLFSNVKPLSEPVTFKFIPKINETKLISDAYLVSEKTTTDLISVLKPSEKQAVFGLVSLTLMGNNTSEDIVVTNTGKLRSPSPSFKIHFDNRKTFWKYINRKKGSEINTQGKKPLTRFGFVEIDPINDFDPSEPANSLYPNPSVKSITKFDGDYYSEIFI